MERIFLIGYMGSGKTTIGKQLAARLDFSFVDMDLHIEEREFKSISKIFEEKGEEEFRLLERKCLHEVAEFENAVISTGGGAPCFFDNMEYMNHRGLTVYLRYTAAELATRLELTHAATRPLLANRKGKELEEFISQGLKVREPFYSQARFAVKGSVEEIVSEICALIHSGQ